MQIIHFKKFCVATCVYYTGTSKVDKLLKMASNSISQGVIFQNFLGHAPRPPSATLGMLRMPVCLHMRVNMPANPTSQ